MSPPVGLLPRRLRPPWLHAGVLVLVLVLLPAAYSLVDERVCIGTNGRMSVPSNREHHYRNLRDRYTNCTYVDGNLELTWLQDESFDLSFLQYIREVTGYVLISHVDVRRIVLPRLQIIRGRTTFKVNINEEEFALFVTLSKMHTLEMPALRDILSGSVGMFNNYNLCHIRTINWDEIITGHNAKYTYVYNFTSPERECPVCHANCTAGCWGEGVENCQQFSKTNCSPQCWQGRCFGPEPRQCCHLFCAGGCTGPKQSDCLACRNFYDDGVCTQECPAMQMYNPVKYSWETNPNGKYAYGATCVKNCPEHLLKDQGACVRSCPPSKKAVNGECVPCGGPCPKTCEGVQTVHAGNIDSFQGCTIIEGSLTILDQSFKGFQMVYSNYSFGPHYPMMHPDRLEVFSTLKEVTGYVNIQGYHEDFTNLSYFRNLEVIGGRALTEYFASLYIVKTSLRSLGLRSLQKVHSGSIAILENKNLCFAQGVDWKRIKKSHEHNTLLQNNKKEEECIADGLVCDKQCSTEGCWGPGPTNCLSCAKFQFQDRCLPDCDTIGGMYRASMGLCKQCHEECDSTCRGPGPGNCTRCRNVRDGPFCTGTCPTSKYAEDGECKPCHANCVYGCSGPENTIGPTGCTSCEKAIINGDVTVERCLQKNESCPDGYYYEWVGPQEQGPLKPLAGKAICRKCHPRCKKCTGYGFHEQVCQECTKFKRGEQCEDECLQDHFAVNGSQECVPCHPECRGCRGPQASDCFNCRNYKIYRGGGQPGDNTTTFNCTATCPSEMPHKIFPQDNRGPYCSSEPVGLPSVELSENPSLHILVGSLVFIFLMAVVVVGSALFYVRKRAKAKENAVKMTMVLTGLDDNEPLRPGAKPNLAKLRIIKEAEMRKGGVLGYGAFGTVYKGVWVPEGENIKIPVAIKVLREGTGASSNKDFLEEAYIMASVEHPNLLQLLAVCMTSQMMLVTQLMPLGCLLDYVRAHRDRIGSKALLNWCTQIARGMAYLEERRLVHRDLAARNVLVQTPQCVKITDFGLAKLLDINEDEYKAAGGKMPIKWLALECIQHRVFTHKSDVWAFGVTIWELLTYGGRPYENVPARDVPELLEKGERLCQPLICTIDVYMMMIKCWMLDAETRPSFKELSDEFSKMARDPGRYLVIQRDHLMRLPNYSSSEAKDDMIRSLSSGIEGPEALVDADEYLTPKSRGPVPVLGPLVPGGPTSITTTTTTTSTSSNSPPRTPSAKGWPGGVNPIAQLSSDSPTPQNQRNWELLRYAAGMSGHQLATAAALVARQQQQQGYAGHPDMQRRMHFAQGLQEALAAYGAEQLKQRENAGSAMEEDCCDTGASKREAQVGSLKLDLPLDEDDYLMPSPQTSQGQGTYMDLIGDPSKMSGENGEARNGGFRTFPDFLQLPGNKPTSVDNPEYHLVSNEPTTPVTPSSAQPLGIPITQPEPAGPSGSSGSSVPVGGVASAAGNGVAGVGGQVFLGHAPRSSEEESDHEYYNDLDRLQRELQPLKPLRRNETTV
ncbi:epidermal growth factor receptor isoform X2 [Thrips palmi]|uniref:Epidermal growth factor receptor n=1 Tax=Thrips palmi TaxID=161013 RepID=A0A6P9AAV4_THRPL|nr:epidermal growth factor receptor isoform X2 [Thrips palmi]